MKSFERFFLWDPEGDVLLGRQKYEPQACAGFAGAGYERRDWLDGKVARYDHHAPGDEGCRRNCFCRCGQPYSAHEQPASEPDAHASKDHGIARNEQPSRTAVPEMPEVLGGYACRSYDTRALHAACVTIAQERDEAQAQLAVAQAALKAARAQGRAIPVATIRCFDGAEGDGHVEWLTYNADDLGHVLGRGEKLYAIRALAEEGE